MTNDSEAELLARDMIDVHGAGAAAIARENARGAALAGRPTEAKSWIGVLTAIQRLQAGKTSMSRGPGKPPAAISEAKSARG
jgi:hypothetical protein